MPHFEDPQSNQHIQSSPSRDSSDRRYGKAVYTIIEKPGDKSIWIRIGWAHVNRDGSYNLTLDALPVNGKLQVRDWVPREDWAGRAPRREDSLASRDDFAFAAAP